MKKMYLFLIVALGLSAHTYAQEAATVQKSKRELADEKRAQYTSAIMLNPQYIAFNGLRFDLEFKLGKNALMIAPVFYMDNNGSNNNGDFCQFGDCSYGSNYEEMIGAGLSLGYKLNLRESNKLIVPYGAIAANYDWFSVTADGFPDNYCFGCEYYDYNYDSYYNYNTIPSQQYFDGTKDLSIHKVGVDLLMGVQFVPFSRFVIDISMGIGGKYSIAENESKFVKEQLGKGFSSIAYSGIAPVSNIKLGIKF